MHWNDGSNANYGKTTELSECKQTCRDHSECAGFVQNSNGCGIWKRGPLSPSPTKTQGHCYKKVEGNNMFLQYYYVFLMVVKVIQCLFNPDISYCYI